MEDSSLYVSAQRFPMQASSLNSLIQPLNTVKKKGYPLKGKNLFEPRTQSYYMSQESDSIPVYESASSLGSVATSNENVVTSKSESSLQELISEQQQPQQLESKPPTPRKKSPDDIVIHVHDDTNRINKDFICNRDLLISEMKYFKFYLMEPKTKTEEIDISVHCDVNIFQWLMEFIKQERGTPPKLEVNWAISILISSHFLEMDSLVDKTLDFVHDNIENILKLPIDLDCIHTDLIEELAQRFTDVELDEIKDRKDKIVNKLFMRKLERMLENEDHVLYRCQHCKTMFTKGQYEWMVCYSEQAKIQVDFHGRAISRHIVDKNWNVNMYLFKLKKSGKSWKEIYWRCWSLVNAFYCVKCNQNFVAAEFNHCNYHKKEAVFERGSIVGEYPCCGGKALKFNSGIIMKKGCCSKGHVIIENEDDLSVIDKSLSCLVNSHIDVLLPFVGPQKEEAKPEEPESDDDIDIFNRLEWSRKEELEDEDEDDVEERVDFLSDKWFKYVS